MSTYHVGQAIEHLPVAVNAGSGRLEGYLSVPTAAKAVILFAHGSGSSRHSPRNRYVADVLNEGSLATLLIDLLNADEQAVDLQTGQLRFDIPFLADRLVTITQWLREQPQVAGLSIGYFGASTGLPRHWWLRRSFHGSSTRWCRGAAGPILRMARSSKCMRLP